MTTTPAPSRQPSEELQQIVAEADTGGRKAAAPVGTVIFWVAVGWSLFQLWYASPLPFTFGFGILNDTEARSLHLGIALFLAFLCYPAFKRSSRTTVAWYDWVLAVVGAFCAALLSCFYASSRCGPASRTCWTSSSARSASCCCSRRRAARWALPMTVAGHPLPRLHHLRPLHAGRARAQGRVAGALLSHQWLTTEGVFGVALGVSSSSSSFTCSSARCSTAPAPATT